MHRVAALLLLFWSLAAAGGQLPTTTVTLADRAFTVEVARDDASRMRGLMFRDTLPDDAGMLFVFEAEQPLAFWMKNTLIPLDILYFDDQLRLVSAARDTPPCKSAYCPSYASDRPARYVLELNAGMADELHLQPGARLQIGPTGGRTQTLD